MFQNGMEDWIDEIIALFGVAVGCLRADGVVDSLLGQTVLL